MNLPLNFWMLGAICSWNFLIFKHTGHGRVSLEAFIGALGNQRSQIGNPNYLQLPHLATTLFGQLCIYLPMAKCIDENMFSQHYAIVLTADLGDTCHKLYIQVSKKHTCIKNCLSQGQDLNQNPWQNVSYTSKFFNFVI